MRGQYSSDGGGGGLGAFGGSCGGGGIFLRCYDAGDHDYHDIDNKN